MKFKLFKTPTDFAEPHDEAMREKAFTLEGLTLYDCWIIMDALAGFSPTDEWAILYQQIGQQLFDAEPI